ncbi:MAG TPA: hypothetical protein VI215_00865 [Bacteroidota bacterium]
MNTRQLPIPHARACCIVSMLFLGIFIARSQSPDESMSRQFKLFGGLSFPMGDFGVSPSPKAGLAETGFTLGAEVCSEVAQQFELGVGAAYTHHSVDISQFQTQFPGVTFSAGSWTLFWFMGVVGFNTPVSPSVSIYGHGNIGLLLAASPDITAFSGGNSATVASSTGNSLGYGLSAGVQFDHRFDAGFRYLTGEPGFTVAGMSAKQSISVIHLTFGYIFH